MHNEILSKCITNFPNMNYVFVMFYNIFSIFCTLDMHFFNMSHFKNTYIFFTTYMYIIANCVRYFLQTHGAIFAFSRFRIVICKNDFRKKFGAKTQKWKTPVFCLKIAKNGLKLEVKGQKCKKNHSSHFFQSKTTKKLF